MQDRTVFDTIQEGLDRANEHATSEAQWVGTHCSEQVVQESQKCVNTQSRGLKPQLVCLYHYPHCWYVANHFCLLHSDRTILLYYTHTACICVLLLCTLWFGKMLHGLEYNMAIHWNTCILQKYCCITFDYPNPCK